MFPQTNIFETGTQTLDFSGWKFDLTTKFSICSSISGLPSAYCEILGITTWYTYPEGSLPFSLIGGFYPVHRGYFSLKGISGYAIYDSIGQVGTAYLGDSTANTNDNLHSPSWTSSRIQIDNPNQYITLPTFQLYPKVLGQTASLTISFWMRILQTGNTGFLFRRTSQDVAFSCFPNIKPLSLRDLRSVFPSLLIPMTK